MSDSGWLYCLYNEGFKSYGEDVFKIGRTNNLRRRLGEYRTGFIHDSYYICVSEREFRNSRRAEALVFYILRKFRLRQEREFFKTSPIKIRALFMRLSFHDDDTIDRCWRAAMRKVCPTEILESLVSEDQEYKIFWEKCEMRSWLDERFEKFRFKPAKPQLYYPYGYRESEKEEQELNELVADLSIDSPCIEDDSRSAS
jgi:hypothetical protein